MGILPEILNNEEEEKESSKELRSGKYSYIVNFINGKMEYKNGRPLIEDKIKATKLYIHKLLITELNKWEFHKGYGCNFKELTIHKRFSNNIIRLSMIKKNLKEQLLRYYNIREVNRIEITPNNNILKISFNLVLYDYSEIEWEESLNVYEFG